MANDDLVGNMDSEKMIEYFKNKGIELQLNEEALRESLRMANEIFIAKA
jgi:hydroxymethylglutaryl-CoA lyase